MFQTVNETEIRWNTLPLKSTTNNFPDCLCGLVVRVPATHSELRVRFPVLSDFLETVGLEWGPLSFTNTTDKLLGRKSSGFGLLNREYGRKDPSSSPRGNLYPQHLALTSPTSGGYSVKFDRGLRPRSSIGNATNFSLYLLAPEISAFFLDFVHHTIV
jgi:hypothetical protein